MDDIPNRSSGPVKAPQGPGDEQPPGNPFVLLMSLIWRLPAWARIPISVIVLMLLAYWTVVPDAQRAELISYAMNGRSGASLFPSVEYEVANYRISIDPKGGATWILNFNFRRLRQEATMLADMIATSGERPEFHSNTHNVKWRIDPYRPKTLPNLDRYVVMLDISKEPLDVPRDADIRYVTPGGFGGATSEWAGVLTLQDTRKAIVNIIFQPNKVGSNFRFSTYQWTTPNDAESLKVDQYRLEGNTLIWEIPNPRLNHVYRVDWNW
jgi:hypothetical protein